MWILCLIDLEHLRHTGEIIMETFYRLLIISWDKTINRWTKYVFYRLNNHIDCIISILIGEGNTAYSCVGQILHDCLHFHGRETSIHPFPVRCRFPLGGWLTWRVCVLLCDYLRWFSWLSVGLRLVWDWENIVIMFIIYSLRSTPSPSSTSNDETVLIHREKLER